MNTAAMKTALKRFGFSDSDPLVLWLNEGLRQFVDAYPWPFIEAIATVNTVAGTETLTLPADYFSVIKARITTEGLPLEYIGRIQYEDEIGNTTATGKPTMFTIVGLNTMYLSPVPNAVYPIRLYYRKTVAELVNDADVAAIPAAYHYTVVQGAAAIALQAENEEDRAVTAAQAFSGGIQSAIQAVSNKQSGEYGQVRDTQGYN